MVKYVGEHPLCGVNELPPDMKGHLGWLVEKGHVIQYFNGLLALPEDNPKFRNLPPRKAAAGGNGPAEGNADAADEGSAENVKKEEVSNEVADKLAQ